MSAPPAPQVRIPWRGRRSPERESFLDEFRPEPSMEAQLNHVLKSRSRGTCKMIQEDEMMSSFMSDRQKHRYRVPGLGRGKATIDKVLLTGLLGSGKTTMLAAAIEQLIGRSSDFDAVCFYFCDLMKDATMVAENLFRTLLCQLAQQSYPAYTELRKCVLDAEPPGIVAEMNYAWDGGFDYLYYRQLLQLFASMNRHFKRVTLVIGNIDMYCGKSEPDAYKIMVQALSDIVAQSKGRLRLLLGSSIAMGEASDLLLDDCKFCVVPVDAKEEEVRVHVRAQLEGRMSSGQGGFDRVDVRNGLEDYIAGNANGSWIWVKSELDLQCSRINSGDWEPHAVASPSRDAQAAALYGPFTLESKTGQFPYDKHLRRVVQSEDPRSVFILRRMLHWVHLQSEASYINMSLNQACEALHLLMSKQHICPAKTAAVSSAEVLDICAPLIRFGPDGQSFEYGHLSVEGYLVKHVSTGEPDMAQFARSDASVDELTRELAVLCLETLQDAATAWRPTNIADDMNRIRQRDETHPFYGFAAAHWHNVCDDEDWGDELVKEYLSPILETGSAPFAAWVVEHRRRRFTSPMSFCAPEWGTTTLPCELYDQFALELRSSIVTSMHAAAALGLANICSNISHREPTVTANQRSQLFGSPLYCALAAQAALGAGLNEPSWRRYASFDKRGAFFLGSTIQCMTNLYAIWNRSELHGPGLGGDTYSLAADLLAAASWMHDADFFIHIMRRSDGPPLDEGFVESVRRRGFMIRPHSLPARPVTGLIWGEVEEFLNEAYMYLVQTVREKLESGRNGGELDMELLTELHGALLNNILEDNLVCARELSLDAESRA